MNLQRKVGNRAVTRLVSEVGISGAADLTIQRDTADTLGGRWNTIKYNKVSDPAPGCEIELEFVPNTLVDSKKVGLMQKIEKVYNGRNLDQEKHARKARGDQLMGPELTAANRTTGRGHWDRSLTETNPIYGAPALKPGQKLAKTPTSDLNMSGMGTQSNYQLGWRYGSGTKEQKRSAKLYDRPNMPSAKAPSSMKFETTAVSVEGKQEGVYYGSVTWGWDMTDDVAGPQLERLTVAEMGTPSPEMKGLATVWTSGTTAIKEYEGTQEKITNIKNTAIPSVAHASIKADEYTDAAAVQNRINALNQTKKTAKGNDKANINFELARLRERMKHLQGG